MVRSKLCWYTSHTVRPQKQKNLYQPSPSFFCFESLTAYLAFQHNLCDHVKGLFLLAFCFFFFFLALPNPSFYNFLDIFSSLVDPYRPVPSLVLALPFPARISPSSVLSYHTLLYPPSLNLAFSPSLLVYIFAVFHSIDPRHNEC